ncbi:hypothetical protein Hamer_G031794, partial [Homarus americanus]
VARVIEKFEVSMETKKSQYDCHLELMHYAQKAYFTNVQSLKDAVNEMENPFRDNSTALLAIFLDGAAVVNLLRPSSARTFQIMPMIFVPCRGSGCDSRQSLSIGEFWVAFGAEKNFRFVAAHEISKALRPDRCAALLTFHAFTGCDTVPTLG